MATACVCEPAINQIHRQAWRPWRRPRDYTLQIAGSKWVNSSTAVVPIDIIISDVTYSP
jgi:hypothetical protein